jgi:hypothetical protein
LPAFYQSLGWRPIETTDYLGKLRTVMAFDLSTEAPRGFGVGTGP